ncbi:MAG: TetR family transcriptional regulator, partial [Caulobacter sp. 39-67-4]
ISHYDQIDAALEAAVAQAGDAPRARLSAYLTASFKPPVLDTQLLAAWLAFWSLVKVNDAIADIHRRTYASYRARLEALLIACDTGVDARLAAIGLTAVVDGLWLELCLDPTVFTPAEAGAIAERLLAGYSPTPVFLD